MKNKNIYLSIVTLSETKGLPFSHHASRATIYFLKSHLFFLFSLSFFLFFPFFSPHFTLISPSFTPIFPSLFINFPLAVRNTIYDLRPFLFKTNPISELPKLTQASICQAVTSIYLRNLQLKTNPNEPKYFVKLDKFAECIILQTKKDKLEFTSYGTD